MEFSFASHNFAKSEACQGFALLSRATGQREIPATASTMTPQQHCAAASRL